MREPSAHQKLQLYKGRLSLASHHSKCIVLNYTRTQETSENTDHSSQHQRRFGSNSLDHRFRDLLQEALQQEETQARGCCSWYAPTRSQVETTDGRGGYSP